MEMAAHLRQIQEQSAAYEERCQDWQFSYEVYQSYLAAFYRRHAQFKERLRRFREQKRNRATMKQGLVASLMQGNGYVIPMPTDNLQVALDRVRAVNPIQGQQLSANMEAVSAFLQTIKAVMQTCKDLPAES